MSAPTPAKADETTDLREALADRISDILLEGCALSPRHFADCLMFSPLAQREAAHAAEIQAREAAEARASRDYWQVEARLMAAEANLIDLARMYGEACRDLMIEAEGRRLFARDYGDACEAEKTAVVRLAVVEAQSEIRDDVMKAEGARADRLAAENTVLVKALTEIIRLHNEPTPCGEAIIAIVRAARAALPAITPKETSDVARA